MTLGAINPITTTWLDGRVLWLGITVQGESEMTPRQPLVSVPYPLKANDVRGADIHPDNVYAATSVFVSSGYGVGVGSATGDGVSVSSHFAKSTEHGIISHIPRRR